VPCAMGKGTANFSRTWVLAYAITESVAELPNTTPTPRDSAASPS